MDENQDIKNLIAVIRFLLQSLKGLAIKYPSIAIEIGEIILKANKLLEE